MLESRRDMEYHGPIRNRLQALLAGRYRRQPLSGGLILAVPGYMTVMFAFVFADQTFTTNPLYMLLGMAGGALFGALIGWAGAGALRKWLLPALRGKARENLAENLLLVKLMDDHSNRYLLTTASGCLRGSTSQAGLREPAGTVRRLMALADYYALICRTEPGIKAWPPVVGKLYWVLAGGGALIVIPVIYVYGRPFFGFMHGLEAALGASRGLGFGLVAGYLWLLFLAIGGLNVLAAIQKQAVVETLLEIIDMDD